MAIDLASLFLRPSDRWRGPSQDAFAMQAGAPQGVSASAIPGAPSGGGVVDSISGIFGGGRSADNQTEQWLTSQGLDPSMAKIVLSNKQLLQSFLLNRMKGGGPLEVNGKLIDPSTYQVIADYSDPKSRQTATINGKLVDTDTGRVIGDYGSDGGDLKAVGADSALYDEKTNTWITPPDRGPDVRTMTAEEVEKAGLPPGVYQQDRGGKITTVGGVREQGADFSRYQDVRKEIQQGPHGRQQASPGRERSMDDAGSRRPFRQDVDQPAGFQILLNHHGRKLADADAVQCRQSEGHHIFSDKTRLVRNRCGCASWTIQAPFMIVVRGSPCQARHGREIGRQ